MERLSPRRIQNQRNQGEEEPEEYEAVPVQGKLGSRRVLSTQVKTDKDEQRENLFHTRCLVQDKVCSLISMEEAVPMWRVKLWLKSWANYQEASAPYKLNWLNETGEMGVKNQVVVPWRPWQSDRRVIHDGFTNRYTLLHEGRKTTLIPLSPQEVYEDQLQLAGKEVKSPKSPKPKNFLVKPKQVKRSLNLNKPFLLFIYKEHLIGLTHTPPEIPSELAQLLQDFSDVFPEDSPPGLPPVRGIEHQIDFVPGSTLPNRPAYRTNPVETKELQRQVDELMEKGHIRESMSPVLFLFFLFLRRMEAGGCVSTAAPSITSL
ncbi:unnamed protein product [Microthlaspi erraticum]|uniref:Uncharacterized protein n=1 Tax=Microthlaspi erraticum TaxID=1685480 RepID=A0A6D2HW68_9BRAS|nr:unnamed protein product [Microthlaspi erraticum]